MLWLNSVWYFCKCVYSDQCFVLLGSHRDFLYKSSGLVGTWCSYIWDVSRRGEWMIDDLTMDCYPVEIVAFISCLVWMWSVFLSMWMWVFRGWEGANLDSLPANCLSNSKGCGKSLQGAARSKMCFSEADSTKQFLFSMYDFELICSRKRFF